MCDEGSVTDSAQNYEFHNFDHRSKCNWKVEPNSQISQKFTEMKPYNYSLFGGSIELNINYGKNVGFPVSLPTFTSHVTMHY